MKKVIAIIAVSVFILFQLKAQKLKVVSSASIFHDMAQNVGGDLFDYEMVVPVGGDPHIHEPTPGDARLIASADLILINGLTFEGWMNELIENSGTKAKVVLITEGVQVLRSDKYQASTDPHAWMTAANGRVYIRNIKNALIDILPGEITKIENNYQKYDKILVDLDQYIFDEISQIPKEKRLVITSHDAFQYFGNYYGLELDAVLGLSTEAEIQTSDIRRVNKLIKERNLPAIFIESTINPKVIKQIAQDKKVSIGGSLYADSLGEKGSASGTYIGMLRNNTKVIVDGLLGKTQGQELTTATGEKSGSSLWIYLLLGAIFLGSFLFVILKLNKS